MKIDHVSMIYHDIPMMNGSCPKPSDFITRYYKHDNNHIRRFSKYGYPKMIHCLKEFHLPFWGTSIFKPINYSHIYHKPYLTYVVICYKPTDISCLTMAPPNPSVSHLSHLRPHTGGAVASSPSDSVITTAWGIKSRQWRINFQKMSLMLI